MGGQVVYDLYFGTSKYSLKLKASKIRENEYTVGNLKSGGRRYYWKVVAVDDEGSKSESPIWNFETENNPPRAPSYPKPYDGAQNVKSPVILSWSPSYDPDRNEVRYDLYMGTSMYDLKIIARDLTSPSYTVDRLEGERTYYWQVVAKDESGAFSKSPIWSFKTIPPGNIQWQKTLGGSDEDRAYSIAQTKDGGYIVAGYTWSNDGDVNGYHGGEGGDMWIVKFSGDE